MARRKWFSGVRQPAEYCQWHHKVRYDKISAVTAANARWRDAHERLRIYECPQCGGWHLTSQLERDHD